jgi:hypothetical protein
MLITFIFRLNLELQLFAKMRQKRTFKISDHKRINKQVSLNRRTMGNFRHAVRFNIIARSRIQSTHLSIPDLSEILFIHFGLFFEG